MYYRTVFLSLILNITIGVQARRISIMDPVLLSRATALQQQIPHASRGGQLCG